MGRGVVQRDCAGAMELPTSERGWYGSSDGLRSDDGGGGGDPPSAAHSASIAAAAAAASVLEPQYHGVPPPYYHHIPPYASSQNLSSGFQVPLRRLQTPKRPEVIAAADVVVPPPLAPQRNVSCRQITIALSLVPQ
ncbi:hypothetical protein AAG570_005070 [Ranatra chinensis]|uniref:Uncharacterized protein n=1 Tax=Ranatra chinensis TaxID=642074 RepID=A0ABD0YC53_9HEMI